MDKSLQPRIQQADLEAIADGPPQNKEVVRSSNLTANGPNYVVKVIEDLCDLPVHYERLFCQAAEESIFFTLPWFKNFLATILAPHERPRIFAVETAGPAPTAQAVLVMHYDASISGPFRRRCLKSLGNYYTSLFGVIMDENHPDAGRIFDTLSSAIINDTMRWDEIDLRPLALEGPYFQGLISALRKCGGLAHDYFCFGNWFLKVNGQSYDEYLKTRPSRISKTATRMRRNLEKGQSFRFVLYQGLEGIEQAIIDYNAVYNSSWKVQEPYPNFIPGFIRTCAAFGWLRLGIAYMDNEPAAAQLWTVVGEQASIYKMAYVERFAKQSIGTVVTGLLMQHVLEIDNVKVVDYLSGDDSYKRDWMSDRRERWGIRVFNPRTLRGMVAASQHMAGRAKRRTVDTIRALRTAKS